MAEEEGPRQSATLVLHPSAAGIVLASKGRGVATKKAGSSVTHLQRHGFDTSRVKRFSNIDSTYEVLETGGAGAVIFVPSVDGIGRNPRTYAREPDLPAGTGVPLPMVTEFLDV